jgi:hypothetical protein
MITEALVTQSESEHSSISVGIFLRYPLLSILMLNNLSIFIYRNINRKLSLQVNEKKEDRQKKIRTHWKVKETK